MIEKDLGQIIPDITATATIDNTEGVPSVSVTVDELNELNRLVRKFNFAFLHLKGEKGDKPVKGIDYLTEEEKQQFTTETLGLVTAEGNKQIEAVGNKGTEQAGKVTSEGSKQITLVSGEANKVITQLKELIAGNPDTSNAQALSGKSRIEFERDTQALAGKYAGNFPLTAAVKDAVYLVPATGKFYVCTTPYNGSNLTAPNANFEEMSVWANRDKLSNLSGYRLLCEGTFREEDINKEIELFDLRDLRIAGKMFPALEIVCLASVSSVNYSPIAHCTKFLHIPCVGDNEATKIADISTYQDKTYYKTVFSIKRNTNKLTAKVEKAGYKYAVFVLEHKMYF